MKVTVVPAQVTTVEDRIIGSLGFSQMLLLIVPVFVSAGLFVLLPPFMGGAVYKYVTMGVIAFICAILAIRIKGRIVASWFVTILRYNLRPKYYVFNKNVTTLRQDYPNVPEADQSESQQSLNTAKTLLPRLDTLATAKVMATIENPEMNLRFETTKKGGLHVRFTEIKDEN